MHKPESTVPALVAFFVRRVPASLLAGLLVITGIIGYGSMTKESLPDLKIPQAHVTTRWDGASPLMVEKEITQRLEQEIKSLKGLKSYTSTSQDQFSIVAVQFQADRPVNESMQLLQRAVAAAEALLPKDADKPKIEASSVRDIPIATVALTGRASDEDLARGSRAIRDRIQKISGVRRVEIVGERKLVVEVALRPDRLSALGISAADVRDTLKAHNFDLPWGRFENRELGFSIQLRGAFRDLDVMRQMVVARLGDRSVVRLGDIAMLRQQPARRRAIASLSWQGSDFESVVALNVLKDPGQDTSALVDEVRATVAAMAGEPSWPAGCDYRIIGDESEVISTELDRGLTNAWQSMLVVFVVLLILLSWREAAVAAISVPITLLGSIGVLWALGHTFNLLVIVGMILALGLLVDDFILIMEGMHEGVSVKRLGFTKALARTMRLYAVPSLSGTITTVLVMLPLAFLGGIDGKFMRVIPVTAAVCLTMSYAVSILLGPALFRLTLAGKAQHAGPNAMDRISERAGRRLASWLGRRVLAGKRPAAWSIGALVLFLLSASVFLLMRNTLYPKEDGRTLGITVQLVPGTTLEESEIVARELGSILQKKEYFQHVLRVVGGKDPYSLESMLDLLSPTQGSHLIGFACFFVPRSERESLGHEYVEPIRAELEAVLAEVPGSRLYLKPAIGGPSGEDAIQIDISGDDMERLKEISRAVQRRLEIVPGVVDVRDNLGSERLAMRFEPIYEALTFYNVSQESLGKQVIAYMQNERIGKFRRPGTEDDLDITLGTAWPSRDGRFGGARSWTELQSLSIITDDGQRVPLWSLAEPRMIQEFEVLPHRQGRRTVTVMAKLTTAYASEVLYVMRPALEEMKAEWPAGTTYLFAGEEDVDTTYRNMGTAFLIAILLIYAILALLFDSFLQPSLILCTVLFSLIGVFLGFFFSAMPFSFSASIGIVALVGIVVNDAIILIETMNVHLSQGSSVVDAATHGASERLRPIVTTTVTNLGGLAPLALSDPGWAPLCWAIIFGELVATVGAMVVVPALYVLVTQPTQTESLGHEAR